MPDWAAVHRELRRPNVTLSLLWEEYRGGTGAQDGFGYSWFCDLYREWVGRLKPTLRQVHTAGERVFVDFAGHAMEVIDGATGEVCRAEIFVAVLGASSYTFAQSVWTQSLPDWIAAHVAMLAFIGGVPRQIVSDNLRAGITRACFYEPLVNRTYADMASHYGTAVVPARPYIAVTTRIYASVPKNVSGWAGRTVCPRCGRYWPPWDTVLHLSGKARSPRQLPLTRLSGHWPRRGTRVLAWFAARP